MCCSISEIYQRPMFNLQLVKFIRDLCSFASDLKC